MTITIYFRDGTSSHFPHEGRSGGSYENSIHYGDGMVIVADVWGNEKAFPLDLVARVETTPSRPY